MKIYNLSSLQLSPTDISLLSKGLNFAPINKPNPFLLFKDLNRYIRNLTLKRFFLAKQNKPNTNTIDLPSVIPSPDLFEYDGDIIDALESLTGEEDTLNLLTQHLATSPPISYSSLKPKSVFYPAQSKGPYLESFYRVVYADFLKLCQSSSRVPPHIHNLSPSEIQALDSLIHTSDVIIKSADKGGGIVLLNKADYIKEANRLLSNKTTYRKLKKDPTIDFTIEVNVIVKSALERGVINKTEASFFTKSFYQTPYFYYLPKVHKNLTSPPGRPIVAAMDSVTTGFSQYIDQFLQPIVQQLPSYIRDGTHLLELLTPYKWESSYIWLSLDVTSLYTSIPHQFGLLALEFYLAQDPFMNPRQAAFILEATNFCLTHNYFNFDGEFYLQIQGTAMGANFAPSYANLAMGYWEEHYISHNNPYSSYIVFFGRYIDDLIVIWDGPIDSITSFVDHCNHNPYGLSFTHVSDPNCLAFLDLELSHVDESIIAKNYIKPTAGNSFLHYKSCHYPKWTNNIPKGQFCRLRH